MFRRRADGKFGLALLVLVVVGAALYFVTRSAMAPVMDAEFDRGVAAAMKANPAITAEQMAAGKGFAETFGAVIVIVGAPIGALLIGLIVLLGGKIVGAQLGYGQSATIATYAMFPRLVESLVNGLQANFMDVAAISSRFSVSLGLGRLLDQDTVNPLLFALAARVDLFTLWVTVLIAVGIKVIGKVTAADAAIGAALIWLIGALPALFQGWRAM